MKKICLLIITAVSLCLGLAVFAGNNNQAMATTPATFTPAQVSQIQGIIHSYLVKNPTVLVEASKALQVQQEKQMQSAAMSAVEANKADLFNDTQSPSIGNPKAAVTLVEFFDYQCGHCRAMAPLIEKLVSDNKNLRVIFKELPIFGGDSKYAAEAALASMKQGKYYEFHNELFTAGGPLNKDAVMALAKKAGLNIAKLKRDMNSTEIQKQLQSNFKLAQALKIIGTPTFVLSNADHTKFHYIPGATTLHDLTSKIETLQ